MIIIYKQLNFSVSKIAYSNMYNEKNWDFCGYTSLIASKATCHQEIPGVPRRDIV